MGWKLWQERTHNTGASNWAASWVAAFYNQHSAGPWQVLRFVQLIQMPCRKLMETLRCRDLGLMFGALPALKTSLIFFQGYFQLLVSIHVNTWQTLPFTIFYPHLFCHVCHLQDECHHMSLLDLLVRPRMKGPLTSMLTCARPCFCTQSKIIRAQPFEVWGWNFWFWSSSCTESCDFSPKANQDALQNWHSGLWYFISSWHFRSCQSSSAHRQTTQLPSAQQQQQ